MCLISQFTSETNHALDSQLEHLINEASIELSRRRQQAQHLQAELQLQAESYLSESQQAAAILQQSWDTIQQEKEKFRCYYKELRDAHILASQDASRASRNQAQSYTKLHTIQQDNYRKCGEYEMAVQEPHAFIQSLNDTVAERDGEICHHQEEMFFRQRHVEETQDDVNDWKIEHPPFPAPTSMNSRETCGINSSAGSGTVSVHPVIPDSGTPFKASSASRLSEISGKPPTK